MMTTLRMLTLQSTLVGKRALKPILSIGSHTLETSALMLASMVTIMSELSAGLPRAGMSQTMVHVLRRSALHGVPGVGLHGFLAMAPFDVGVVRLAAGFANGVGGEGAAGGCGAGGVGFSVEFGGVVLGRDFPAGLVLVECQLYIHHIHLIILDNAPLRVHDASSAPDRA